MVEEGNYVPPWKIPKALQWEPVPPKEVYVPSKWIPQPAKYEAQDPYRARGTMIRLINDGPPPQARD